VRFAIVGAGAIGAYVGAALARGGADVTLIARGEHLAAMQARGVRVLSPRGDFEAHPAATDDVGAIDTADFVFVGLKAYSLPELAPRIGAALRPGAAVIAAQNGIPWWYFQSEGGPFDGSIVESVDPGGVISASIPPESVVGCVVYCATEIVAPGVIRHIEGTRFSIGEPDGSTTERCRTISDAFRAGGLKCPVDTIWLKLIGNAAFNPVSVLTGGDPRRARRAAADAQAPAGPA
jgi:2-dehydropantoate 2-reductase